MFRSGLSDLNRVQIEATLLLYDNDNSHSDDIEALTIRFGYQRYRTKADNLQNIEKKLQR